MYPRALHFAAFADYALAVLRGGVVAGVEVLQSRVHLARVRIVERPVDPPPPPRGKRALEVFRADYGCVQGRSGLSDLAEGLA